MTRILLIGAGNMNGAIYKALCKKFEKKDILIADIDSNKVKNLGVDLDKAYTDYNEAIIKEKVDLVLLGVKPQTFENLSFIEGFSNKTVISIMAGVKVSKIKTKTNSEKIVRTMPNLGASVKSSFTGWFAKNLSFEEESVVVNILESFGEQLRVAREKDLNKITALSGSGPAYYFYLTQLLQEQAQNMGFTNIQAQKIASLVLSGSSKLLRKNKIPAKQLKDAVTSKGGTTEACLKHLESNKWGDIFKEGISKAKERADELGD